MSAVAWLVRKDVRRFLGDRNGLFASVAMPVILGAFLGTLFAPREDKNPVVVPFVAASGNASQRFETELRKATVLSVEATASADEARRLVREGKRSVAIIASEGGAAPAIQLVSDPSRSAEADLVRGMVEAALYKSLATAFSDPVSKVEATAGLTTLLAAGGVGEAGKAAGVVAGLVSGMAAGDGLGGALKVSTEQAAPDDAPAYDSYAHNFAGMLCMFLLFFAIEQAKERLNERALGLDRRVAMAPIGPVVPRLAGALSTTLLALGISVVVFTVAMVGFGVRIRGSVPGFVLVAVGQAVFAGGFAMALAGWIRSPRAVQGVGSAFSLIASFMGGAWMPSFILPQWCQKVAVVLPTRWATEGFAATTWRGLGFSAAVMPALILMALGVVLGVLGAMPRGRT